MKRNLVNPNWAKAITLLVVLLISFSLSGSADRIVALVGDDIILNSELQTALDFLKLQAGAEFKLDSNLIEQILDRLIEDRLILEEAKRETITVAKSELENEVESNINALIGRFQDRTEFEKALAEEGLTERTLRERYREETRKRLIAQKLLAKKGLTTIYISPSEAKRFYQEKKDSIAFVPGVVTLAHILFRIMPSPSVEVEAQKRSLEIYDILLRGGDFDEVARSFSEDERTRKRGGYLGELKRGELFWTVESTLFALKPGEISPPVRSPMGYQIFQIASRTENSVKASHILIKVPIRRADTLRIQKLAQSVRNKLLAGADFDSMARIHSDDPETKNQGGFLGQFLIKGLTPPFNSVVEKLETGEISEPILSEHGYHILKVIAKEEAKTLTFEELQDKIRNYLYQERFAQKLKDYLERVAARTFIAKKL
ncbi:MAG: peptidylprolyl isomerase [candidate division WOR-3 bacterium]